MRRKEQPFPAIQESIRTLFDLFYIFSHEKSMDEYSKIPCFPQLFLLDFLGMNTDSFSFGGRLKQPPPLFCTSFTILQHLYVRINMQIAQTSSKSFWQHSVSDVLSCLSLPLLFFRQSAPHFSQLCAMRKVSPTQKKCLTFEKSML